MRRAPLKFVFEYSDAPERRIVSLERDGVPCLPVLAFDTFKKKLDVSPVHVHDECLEISLCLRGDLEFEVEGHSYPFRPDTVFVTRPEERHRLKYYPRSMSKYWVLFRIPKGDFPLLNLPPDEAKWLREEMVSLPRRYTDQGHRVRSAFQRLFHVHDSVKAGTPMRRCLLRNAALSLFVALVETAKSKERVRPTTRLAGIVEEIRKDPGRSWTVDDLARRAAVSPTGLLQRFKRLTGFPPHAFVVACRIESAKRELASDKLSITAIARKLGFPSAQHFSTTFRRVEGLTPTAWRSRKGAR